MDYKTYINSTIPRKKYELIRINKDGYCCYNTILYILKKYNLVSKYINPIHILRKASKWIEENRNKYIQMCDDTIENIVLYTHSLEDFDEYKLLYRTYNFNTPWGGLPEFIALSNLYNININIYTYHSYSKKNKQIINCNNLNYKTGRYKLKLCIKDNYKYKCNILWTNNNHFDILI